MKREHYKLSVNSDRGIALLVVLFSLLLLSVIGLGMMYSTNMETSINYNYRDKQIAFYAAMAGLQEARDRIQPATHNIVAPTQLPSTSLQNIIYIVANAASVNPWDTTNAYFDTELCQEQILSLARTVGVPCTTIASGTGWYSVKDDSLSSSAPWNITNPLDLKWVRIELKGNNMTPVAVNGDSSSAAETCWTGANEMSTPTGYTTGCRPSGGLTSVTIITSGAYTAATPVPTVTLTGGGGTGGAATAVMASTSLTNGVVSVVNLTTGGAGYSSVPGGSSQWWRRGGCYSDGNARHQHRYQRLCDDSHLDDRRVGLLDCSGCYDQWRRRSGCYRSGDDCDIDDGYGHYARQHRKPMLFDSSNRFNYRWWRVGSGRACNA